MTAFKDDITRDNACRSSTNLVGLHGEHTRYPSRVIRLWDLWPLTDSETTQIRDHTSHTRRNDPLLSEIRHCVEPSRTCRTAHGAHIAHIECSFICVGIKRAFASPMLWTQLQQPAHRADVNPTICWGINFGCKQKMTVRSIADFARRAHSLLPCGEQEATGSLMFGTNCQVLCVSYGVSSDR